MSPSFTIRRPEHMTILQHDSSQLIHTSLLQVNIPKTRNTFCWKCKKHQAHKVTQYKKSKVRNVMLPLL